jgi:NIPSNAP
LLEVHDIAQPLGRTVGDVEFLTALQARFRDPICALLEQHGVKNVGYWTNAIGGRDDQLVYMVSFESLAQREEAWDSFGADPEWHRVRAETGGRAARAVPGEPDPATDRLLAAALSAHIIFDARRSSPSDQGSGDARSVRVGRERLYDLAGGCERWRGRS